MWDFSGDEWLFFIAAAGVAAMAAVSWYRPLVRVSALGARRGLRVALAVVPVLCLALLYVVLQTWADPVSVACHLDYVTLFPVGGAAWRLGAAVWGFPFLVVGV